MASNRVVDHGVPVEGTHGSRDTLPVPAYMVVIRHINRCGAGAAKAGERHSLGTTAGGVRSRDLAF